MTTNAQPSTVDLDAPAPPRVPWGLSSTIGIIAMIGMILSALAANDVATVVTGSATIVAMLGRYGQAIAYAVTFARAALPWVQAVADLETPDQGSGRP